MRTLRLCLSIAVAFIFLPAVCMANSVTANGLTLTLDTSNLTVTEGDTLTVQFTVTNGTGGAINLFASGGGNPGPVSLGDLSDFITNSSLTGSGTCKLGGSLGTGSSCTLIFNYQTPNDTGETDADFGISGNGFGVAPDSLSCQIGGPNCAVILYQITVQDPVSTPEASSLLSLGIGMLGLVLVIRRGHALR